MARLVGGRLFASDFITLMSPISVKRSFNMRALQAEFILVVPFVCMV